MSESLGQSALEAESRPRRVTIERNRRLLNPAGEQEMMEYYDSVLQTRVIAMPRDSEQARVYERLVVARLPVFSGLYVENELQLTVPAGTRLFHRQLKSVARDIPNYGEIFNKLGATVRSLYETDFGMPEPYTDRTFFDNFVFSTGNRDMYGGSILLVPPFRLNPDVTVHQVFGFIRTELERSDLFKSDEVENLLERAEQGWHVEPV